MNAAIYCPGPSLAAMDNLGHKDLSIAVNRAAIFAPCDIWACADPAPWRSCNEQVRRKVSPELFTMRSTVDALHGELVDWPGPITDFESLFGYIERTKIPWTRFTMLASIVLAASRGATRITIFGCDWTHEPDWDGNTDSLENREQHRWDMERGIFKSLSKCLAERGIEVVRHTAGVLQA